MIKTVNDIETEITETVMDHFWSGRLQLDFENELELENLERIIEFVGYEIEKYNIDEIISNKTECDLTEKEIDIERRLLIHGISLQVFHKLRRL